MRTGKFGRVLGFVFCSILAGPFCGFATPTSVPKEFPPIEWSFQGNPIPDTYWSPWVPLGTQEALRFKLGFRFSSGTMGFKCPVKLTFTYDPQQAKSGQDFHVKVKAELVSASYNTWESAFGIKLPNKIQVGFFGITGVPDILPWWDLPWDFWDLVGYAPKVGSLVSSAEDNIGVNTASKDALPLGTTKYYHDQRTLISVDPTTIMDAYEGGKWKKYQNKIDQFKTDRALKILERIPDDIFDGMLLTVQVYKRVDRAGAQDFLIGITKKGLDQVFKLAKIACVADPYFYIDGKSLRVNVRAYITNGKGSGVYQLNFTSPGQEQEFVFRDITPFVGSGDKLVLTVDDIMYEGKVWQGLTPKLDLSLWTVDALGCGEKLVDWVHAQRDYTETDFKAEIPVLISNDIIQSMRSSPGCTSVMISWSSPVTPLKGTVNTYDGTSLVKTVTESTFRTAHNVIVPGLTPGKSYRFTIDCAGEQGQQVPAGEVTDTTRTGCPGRVESSTCGPLTLSNPSAQAGTDYLDFTWSTNQAASSEVMISPSPDISVNYVMSIKKQSGEVVTGWADRGGPREFVTSHSMRVTALEPGTTYYYNLRSRTFENNNNETSNPLDSVGFVGQIATLPPPAPPFVRVKVQFQNTPVPNIPVEVTKTGGSTVTFVTGSDGFTPQTLEEKGATYNYAIKNQGCYKDASISGGTVPSTATGEWSLPQITLESKAPQGAHVYDAKGLPVSGAAVTSSGKTATTDTNGYYTFGTWLPLSSTAISISKNAFITQQITGKVEQCGLTRTFTIPDCILQSGLTMLNITVKNQSGAAVNGAAVSIKEASAVMANLTANAQGKVSWTHSYTENTQEHKLTITATPPASAKLLPASIGVNVVGGSQQDIDVMCIPVPPPDTQAPVISDVNFNQPNSNTIGISFKSNEEVNTVSLEYKFPNGQTKNTPWYTYNSSLFLGNVAAGYKTAIGDTSIVGGVYKIRIRCKDKAGNQSESGQYDFTMFGDAVWGLKSTAVTTNSIALSWEKFPYTADFAKYTLTAASTKGGTTAEITDINQISRTLTGLVPNTNYTINLGAQSKAGQMLAAKATLNVWTGALAAPVIRGFEPSPKGQEVNKNITVTAKITDSDSHVKKVTLRATYKDTKKESQIASQDCDTNNLNYSQTFSFNQAGIYYLTLEARDESTPTEETIEYEVLSASAPSGKEEEPQKAEPSEETKSKETQPKANKLTTKTKTMEEQQPETKTEPMKADASLAVSDIKEPVYAKQKVTVTVTVKNDSEAAITGGKLRFYIDYKLHGSQKTVALQSGETKNIDFSFTLSKTGTSAVKWELIVPENFNDSAPENNIVERSINVLPRPAAQAEQKVQTDAQTAAETTKQIIPEETKTKVVQETKTAGTKAATKLPTPKIDIKNITITSEEKGAIPVGLPLTVLVDVNATDNFAGPFAVNMELKKGQEKQTFTQTIEKLEQGPNSFKWDLVKEPQAGSYTLSIEISNAGLKLKDKSTKTFRVIEKKTGTKQ